MGSIKKEFENTLKWAVETVEAGKPEEALSTIEELLLCFNLENDVVMLHNYVLEQLEHREEETLEEPEDDSIEARLRKLNPDFKPKKGARKSQKRSFGQRLRDFLEKEE